MRDRVVGILGRLVVLAPRVRALRVRKADQVDAGTIVLDLDTDPGTGKTPS